MLASEAVRQQTCNLLVDLPTWIASHPKPLKPDVNKFMWLRVIWGWLLFHSQLLSVLKNTSSGISYMKFTFIELVINFVLPNQTLDVVPCRLVLLNRKFQSCIALRVGCLSSAKTLPEIRVVIRRRFKKKKKKTPTSLDFFLVQFVSRAPVENSAYLDIATVYL